LALEDPKSITLTEDHIVRTVFLSEKRAFKMLRNFEQQEKELDDSFIEDEAELMKKMANSKKVNGKEERAVQGEKTTRKSRRGRPGERKPERDPIGGADSKDLAA
jgi:hypothetical protein